MNDLENKLGDKSFAPAIRAANLAVRVRREGVGVLLTIGNAGPFRFDFKEAIRQGHRWAVEGQRAKRAGRMAELKLGTGKMQAPGATLLMLANWLIAKGMEAKVLSGAMKQRIETGALTRR